MSKFKNVTSAVLVICFMLSLVLSGCGNKAGTDKAAGSADTSTKVETKPVTLKYVMMGPGKQSDSDRVWEEFNKKLQEKLPNTTVEFEVIPGNQFAEKWKLMMASAEPVDIAWSGYVLTLVNEVRKGSYLPLDELIDKYAPDIRKEIPASLIERERIDGKIYAIPNYQQEVFPPRAIRIPKDIADKYFDIAKIKSAINSSETMNKEVLDELEKGLEKAKAANEVRKGVAMSFADNMKDKGYETVGFIANVKRSDKSYTVIKQDTPEKLMMNERMTDWYQKGYIRKDILSLQNATEDEGKKDGYIMWASQWFNGQDEIDTAKFGFPIVTIPYDEKFYIPAVPVATATALPMTCRNKERAIQFMDLLDTAKGKDLINLLTYGLEDVHYKKTADNKIETLGYVGSPKADSKYGMNKWAVGNTFNAYETQADTPGWNDYIKDLQLKAPPSVFTGFVFETDAIKTEMAQIDAVKKEYNNAFLSGALPDYKTKYAEYTEKMKKAGNDKVAEEAQKQIDAFLKSKGLK